MIEHEKFVASALDLKAKNLAFFEKFYPGIFSYFQHYQLKKSKLDIQPEKNELDLIEDGRHLYGGARNYAIREVDQFLTYFDYGKTIQSINPLYEGDYKNKRFFAQHIDRIYKKSSLKKDSFKGYVIPDFFPLTVFMGSGLGLHIKALTNSRNLMHAVVVETNMDRFFSTFYAVEWELIIKPYLFSHEKSFKFILIPDSENDQQIRDLVWNNLIEYCPFFPVMTLFYNHLGDSKYDKIIDSINSDLYVHLFSFGNYDDELNQLNNAIHNFKRKVKKLPLPPQRGFNFPICIVGSGPSLDVRADWLKENQNNLLLVSCGSALGALVKLDIHPDLHIELESDFRTYATLCLNEDRDFFKSVKLIGAAQLNPLIIDMFEDVRVFFKAEGVLQGMFANEGEAIREAAPTCTNAGLAFAFHFGFSKVFLFGLDYGFKDKTKHHSKGSIYYKVDGPKSLKESVDYKEEDLIEVDSANGGKIKTTNFLYASKRRTENIIQAVKHPNIFNCSTGSRLLNTKYLDSKEVFSSLLIDSSFKDDGLCLLKKQEVISALFNKKCNGIDNPTILNRIGTAKSILEEIKKQCLAFLIKPIKDDQEMSSVCYRLNHFIEHELRLKSEHMYYFIRGSIRHFLHAGLSHTLALVDVHDKQSFICDWQAIFVDFLNELVEHFDSIFSKDFNLEKDPLVHRSIADSEIDEPGSLAPDFASLSWRFTGDLIDSQGRYHSYQSRWV